MHLLPHPGIGPTGQLEPRGRVLLKVTLALIVIALAVAALDFAAVQSGAMPGIALTAADRP